jgi:alpha-D-xyloside xylohydrolase
VANKLEMWFWHGDFDDGVDDLGYRELCVRWFQFGAFLPMFRSHGTDTPREVWRFGEPGDLFCDTLKKFLQLRYRLLSYIYSLAGWTTQDVYTMMRALPFDLRGDMQTYDCGDQFMFRPAFFVNPVTAPMYYTHHSLPVVNAECTRRVYLPAGAEWFDFWTDEFYSGGQTIDAIATLDTIPLFVRSGSIVPMGPDRQFVGNQTEAPTDLHVYGGANGRFVLYEDEGDNYNYEIGAFSEIQINWEEESNKLILGKRKGNYPGIRWQREFRILLHGSGSGQL